MADVIFLILIVAFFGAMVLLVKACDHIIGPDDVTAESDATGRAQDDTGVDAGAPTAGAAS